jgi:hypothetical protein
VGTNSGAASGDAAVVFLATVAARVLLRSHRPESGVSTRT